MPGPFHTLTYPAQPGASRSGMAFPAKPPGARRTYVFDFTAWLGDANTTIMGTSVACDASLTVLVDAAGPKSVTLTVSGGDPAVPLPVIALMINLADGDLELVDVFQPIMPMPAGPVPQPASMHALFRDASSLSMRDGTHLTYR